MNVIIPILDIWGEGFIEAGYSTPKPLINLLGDSIIKKMISFLKLKEYDKLFIVYNKELEEYNFVPYIKNNFPDLNIEFVSLIRNKEKNRESVENAFKEIKKESCILLNYYTFYYEDILEKFRVRENKNFIFCQNENLTRYGALGFSKIETLISLLNLEIDISDIEAISSKIIINDYFNVFSVSDLLSYKDREENFIKKRFCFDLDNTLVTYPKIKGDYSTVEPIVKNIEYLRFLKESGHHIIIYTARKMTTHGGNIGKIFADVGKTTLDTLEKFEIPFDEIFFGKPNADFYIDDLAINSRHEISKLTGFFDCNIISEKNK